jgi:hypothetical protein
VFKEGGIGKYAVDMLLAYPETSNQAIAQAVRRKFPNANTSKESISWYRAKRKRLSKAEPSKDPESVSAPMSTQTTGADLDNTGAFRVFSREDLDSVEFTRVLEIARSLRDHMNSNDIRSKLVAANVPEGKSHEVQACFADHAEVLGFQTEKRGLFTEYKVAALRPDYYLRISEGRGIMLEVERGRTVENNNDILDLWKCHICKEAQYLFLVVPLNRVGKKKKTTPVFSRVVYRVEPFFRKHNYVNVYGAAIFGY